jgi:hypothetical protein
MLDLPEDYDNVKTSNLQQTGGSYREPTLLENANQRIIKLEKEIKDQKELIVLLERNPDVQRVIELLRRKR